MLKKDDLKNAIDCYDKAIEIKNDYYEAYHNKGNAYSKMNDSINAIKCFDAALKIKSDYLPALKSRNSFYINQKKFDKALPQLDKLLIYEPDNIDFYVQKADILSEINNQNDSNVEELKKAKMHNDKSVEDNLVALIAKIGEKITIGKTKTISHSSSVNYQYLHTVVKDNLAKLAVVVSLETKDNSDTVKTFGKQLSMHIAASNPLALDSSLIDKSIIDKEQELVSKELMNSGKPEDIAKKISLGKMNKFKEENALLTQAWVMEPKKKVQDVLKELAINDLKIKEFSRIKIGE